MGQTLIKGVKPVLDIESKTIKDFIREYDLITVFKGKNFDSFNDEDFLTLDMDATIETDFIEYNLYGQYDEITYKENQFQNLKDAWLYSLNHAINRCEKIKANINKISIFSNLIRSKEERKNNQKLKEHIEDSLRTLYEAKKDEKYIYYAEKYISNRFNKDCVKIPEKVLDVGDSIYVLHIGSLKDRRLSGSPFSLEEYVIKDHIHRINYGDGKNEVDNIYDLEASVKTKKENGCYFDVVISPSYINGECKLVVNSEYIEVFATKKAAQDFIKKLRKETDSFLEKLETI